MAATPTWEDKQKAIAFARSEFCKGTRFWPRLLVKYAECCCEGGALDFAVRLYSSMARESGRILLHDWLRELREVVGKPIDLDPLLLQERSRAIWGDNRDRSVEKRGISRLFGALSLQRECNTRAYEIEVTRSLSLFADAPTANDELSRFEQVIRDFDKEFS